MRSLGDIPSKALIVECGPCRRRGTYQVARLATRHGDAFPLASFRATMRAHCGKTPCHAELAVPLRLGLDREAFPGNRFCLDIWETDVAIEMHVGSMLNFEIASAAFDKAVALWPHSTITLRVGMHAFRAHRPKDDTAEASQALIGRWITGRYPRR